MGSPLSPDFDRNNGKDQINSGTTAIGRMIRERRRQLFQRPPLLAPLLARRHSGTGAAAYSM
ncbi:hypothetical protein BN871_EY_00160 [Paenibacillus sp. P22]|nr:hypothetical protein BN871_EY_00160 [Paenibacillus sp. P22]